MPPAASVRARLGPWPGWLALGLALLGGILAVLAATGWSFAFDLGPLRVSLRHATNPAIGTALSVVFGAWWLGLQRFAAFDRRASAWLARHAGRLAAVVSLLVVLVTASHSARVAGGADSAGYLAEARLWLAGSLRVPPPDVGGVTFAHGLEVLAPLGFKPANGQHLVPTYPPGLPLLMAGFERVGGAQAKFWVVPIAAGLLVWLVFTLGHRLAGPDVGLLASAVAATSPTFLFQAVQPMSDVPAACAWLTASLLLTRAPMGAAIGAAGAAIVACVIRPNLFAMVPLLMLAAWWWEPNWRRAVARAALVGASVAAAAIGFAVWQRDLYGALTETGYGGVSYLFSLSHVGPNLLNYSRWLYESHGWFLLLAVAGPLLVGRGGVPDEARLAPCKVAWWMLVMFIGLLAFYTLYFVFDNWTFTRFLLPALPLLFVLVAITLVAILGRLPAAVRTIAFVWLLVFVPSMGASTAREGGAFGLWESERRFVEIGEFARSQPASAVFLSMQHAGSVAYYSGRTVLRWDWIEPEEFDAAITALSSSGRTVYAALEDWEVERLRARLPASAAIAALGAPVYRARDREAIDAFVFLVREAQPATGTRAPVSSAPVNR